MSSLIAIHHIVSVAQLHGHHGHHVPVSLFCTVSRSGVASCIRSFLG